jgi:hypothetical protein
MRKKNPNTKKYSPLHIAHWYFGNYCVIKCHEHEKCLIECNNKLEEFVKKYAEPLTHQEFLELIENHLTICKRPKEDRRKHITWATFSKLCDKGITYTQFMQQKEALKKQR